MRPRTARRTLPLVWLVCSLLVSVPARSALADQPKPNVVLIRTDDQRSDTLWAMPTVQTELVRNGVTFTNGYVVNPHCCPSRTSILTGQYSHTTGVWANAGPYGGFAAFRGDGSTIATWLQGAGYRTALIGKYLNGYDGSRIPPGATGSRCTAPRITATR